MQALSATKGVAYSSTPLEERPKLRTGESNLILWRIISYTWIASMLLAHAS
jgi:hypothetical protein